MLILSSVFTRDTMFLSCGKFSSIHKCKKPPFETDETGFPAEECLCVIRWRSRSKVPAGIGNSNVNEELLSVLVSCISYPSRVSCVPVVLMWQK